MGHHEVRGCAWQRRSAFVGALVLGLVLLADWLFYAQPVGWTLGAFGGALMLALLLRGGRCLRTRPGQLIAGGVLGLLAAMCVEPGPLPISLSLLGLVTLAVIDRGGWTSNVVWWVLRWLSFGVQSLMQPIRDLRICQRWERTRARLGRGSRVARWVVAWGLPVLLSAVFVGLFVIANPVLARWLETAGQWAQTRIEQLETWLTFGRIALWLVVAVGVWGLLRVRADRGNVLNARKKHLEAAPHSDAHQRPVASGAAGPLAVRCLLLFNFVFAVQLGLDGAYLIGDTQLPEGMSYATYAHRGAYPLVATALLAGLFVLVAFRPGGAAERSAWARRLVYLWIAQNIVLLAAAFWRLDLYVEVYSLTRWRLAAGVWMAMVASGFGWVILRLLLGRDNRWLLQRVTLTAGLFLYAACFVNIDGRIADFNVARCQEAGGPGVALDLAYMERLGHEAIPALQRLSDQVASDPEVDGVRRMEITEHLAAMQSALHQQTRNWRGWTWQRSHVAEAVPFDGPHVPAAPPTKDKRGRRLG